MKINKRAVNKLIAEGYLTVQKHLHADLYIYNYTPKTQYEQHWNKWTMLCRGLICNAEGVVLYRPFKKIFNLEEHVAKGRRLPNCGFEVQEKMDGSLGILYEENGLVHVATRGSFRSEQALHATRVLRTKYPKLTITPGRTVLVEIIYPENRIVVDYKDTDDLFFLAVIDVETGIDLQACKEYEAILPSRTTYSQCIKRDIKNLTKKDRDNKEGYVVVFDNGFRVKMKFKEYKRLHWLITSVNSKTIWDLLREGTGIEDMLDHVPDEFYDWVKRTAGQIQNQHKEILWSTALEYMDITAMKNEGKSQREMAERIKRSTFPQVLFAYHNDWKLDRVKDLVWKLVKPETTKPFKEPIDV